MALTQQTDILLLDEPTTFPDWGYQLKVLELLRRLNKTRGLTVVMALHDLNQAAQFADQVAVLATGRLQGLGAPEQVIDETLLARIFRVRGTVTRTEQGHPLCMSGRIGSVPVCRHCI